MHSRRRVSHEASGGDDKYDLKALDDFKSKYIE